MANFLAGLRVLELRGLLAGAVSGRALADAGAEVDAVDLDLGQPPDEDPYTRATLDLPKRVHRAGLEPSRFEALVAGADLLLVAGAPASIEAAGLAPEVLRRRNPGAAVVTVTPFGLEGPMRDDRHSDLVSFHASGLARVLLGAVEDTEADPPVRAAGEQSSFIGGLTAALAAASALYERATTGRGGTRDVSIQEALASMPARELALPAFGGVPARKRTAGQLGLTYVIPASDGHVAISPRESHQWAAWLEVMGSPAWAGDPEMLDRPSRMRHGDRLLAHMSPWSREHTRAELFELAQTAHVPCFPVNAPGEVLRDAQLEHRRFFVDATLPEVGAVRVPSRPYQVHPAPDRLEAAPSQAVPDPHASGGTNARLPLEGIRVVDFSWVIAGPTTTRLLAAMGAEVIKVESPARPDPGRTSELHSVLGLSKRSVAIDLRAEGAAEAVRRLIAQSDVVVENFATGVMERLGLGYAALSRERSDLVMVSASGVGRTGPLADSVAYGTLLQCYTGFSALNGYPGRPPAPGFAWADPLSALMMTTAVIAALHDRRRTGRGAHIDFSMSEALLWTMPGALVAWQQADTHSETGADAEPQGNRSRRFFPHDLYRAAGDDAWLAVAVTSDEEWRALCEVIDALRPLADLDIEGRRAHASEVDTHLAAWARDRDPREAAHVLQQSGVPAAASLDSQQLFEDPHLEARDFYHLIDTPDGVLRLTGLPWRAPDGAPPHLEAARTPGADNESVLRDIAGLTETEVEALRAARAFGE